MPELELRWRTFQGEIDPAKVGTLGGHCNRKACRELGANWWNTVTRAHYYDRCARLINQWPAAVICELVVEEGEEDG